MPAKNILVALFVFNEGEKLRNLMERFPQEAPYDLLFVDDGSTDGSYEFLQNGGRRIIRHEANRGIGCGIREAINYGRKNNYQIIVIMAANGKMLPEEIERLTEPLVAGRYDYVQGSRNLAGGSSPNIPLFRKVTIRLFTVLVNLFTGFHGTDITCGFRAYRLSLFDDRRFNLEQAWLNKYEMEYYIHYHTLKGKYRVTEVPVSMVYPESGKNYSKIRPFTGWWSMIRPWVYLYLRIKK
ncbi:Glycosyltransferases involved in cell wall biogenesis [Candidatus Zixiibacteriota bacterium]|nr:Glycosyltransferases involved in cell wall biogenesis [candidate division Zixibacteria bacterium]